MAGPQFFHEDGQLIIAEMKADMEGLLGRSLSPGDVEVLLINSFAYREKLLRIMANETARQCLVDFSRGDALGYLGALVGVVRLAATGASCILRFTMVEGHTGVVLPKGIRVQSIDGKVVFQTVEEKVVAEGTTTVDIEAICTTAGSVGNGYETGKISIILDPQPFVSTVTNTDTTNGGVDEENDEELRERIKLAPSSFSVAGPRDAYKFFAKSAHPSIVDVAVKDHTPNPGDVSIYPLLKDGGLPSTEILNVVQAICSDEKVRPMNDTVYVEAPTVVNYSINVELVLYAGAINAEVLAQVEAALTAFKNEGLNKLGRDVTRSTIMSKSKIEGKVYDVDVVQPAANVVVAPEEYANCTGITVTITGTNNG